MCSLHTQLGFLLGRTPVFFEQKQNSTEKSDSTSVVTDYSGSFHATGRIANEDIDYSAQTTDYEMCGHLPVRFHPDSCTGVKMQLLYVLYKGQLLHVCESPGFCLFACFLVRHCKVIDPVQYLSFYNEPL